MADLPDPVLMPPAAPGLQPAGGTWLARRRGPRFLPVLLLVLLFAVLAPGPGWVLFGFFKLILIFWLVTSLAAVVFARRFRRRMSRRGPGGYPPDGYGQYADPEPGPRHPRWE